MGTIPKALSRAMHTLLFSAALISPTLPLQAQGLTLPRSDISDVDVSDNAIEQVTRLAGFMIAQTAVLEEIQRQHPDLAGQSAARIAAFEATFSFPAQRAQWFLEDAIGTELTQNFFGSYKEQARQSVAQLSRAQAQEFLSEIDQRLEGQMDEPSFKAMLWLKYAGRSADEMRDWRQRFSSQGHPKSAGLNMSMEAPLSWRQSEGNRPHVLVKWMNQNGSGTMGVTLIVREFPGEHTMADVEEFAAADEWASIVPDNQTFLQGKVVKIDRQPAVEIITSGQTQTLDVSLNHYSHTYMVFPKDRFVSLQCMLAYAPGTDQQVVDTRFQDLQALCRQMAITITFPDTYR